MIRVLFVCMGNICRSPMAEGVFQHLVDEAGLTGQIAVDSAGIGSWHLGEPAHRGTRAVLAAQGIRYQGRARTITRADLEHFDYILAMDADNLDDVRALDARRRSPAEIRLFMDYAPEAEAREVPDPYYSGRFEHVYDLVQQAAIGLLAHIREEHGI